MNVEISVTSEDIANGARANCGHCPVALAVRRCTEADSVRVSGVDVEIAWLGRGLHRRAVLSPGACRWIAHFDEQGVGAPFTFTADFR